jgi:hypothetical protein
VLQHDIRILSPLQTSCLVFWQKFVEESREFEVSMFPTMQTAHVYPFTTSVDFLPHHMSSHSERHNSSHTPLCGPQTSYQEIRLKRYFILLFEERIINDCQPDKMNIMKDAGAIHHFWHLAITTVIYFSFHVL